MHSMMRRILLCSLALSYGAQGLAQGIAASDVEEASLVVSFDQDIAKIVGGKARHLAWDNLPGVLTDYARGRDEIVRHVDDLIDELARSAAP